MVEAQVSLYGTLRDVTNQRKLTLQMPLEFSLGDLVDALAAKLGPQVAKTMASSTWPGYLQGHVVVFVAGERAKGDLSERFGPFAADKPQVDIYIVPNAEGGRDQDRGIDGAAPNG